MKRFKILCVLLLTVFFASVVIDLVLDFIAGAKMGYNMVEYINAMENYGKGLLIILLLMR